MKVGLVGYSGSGKSTAFHWLTGVEPDPGKIQQGQTGMAHVPDERLAKMSAKFKPKKTKYAEIAFLDAHKCGLLLVEVELDHAGGAVTVLFYKNLSLLLFTAAFVVGFAMDEHHDVGVLLDGTGLAQVGEHRALVRAALEVARQLAEREHRDLELTGEDLQPTADRAPRPRSRMVFLTQPPGLF